MKLILLATCLVFLQTTTPTATGTYRQIPTGHDIRHIPIQSLTIKKNGSYKHIYYVTSISAEQTVLGKWELMGQKIILKPQTLIEGKDPKHHAKIRTDCKGLSNDDQCLLKVFTLRNDTLFVDKEGWFVKD